MTDQAATPWGTPWESMRGFWTTDYNNWLTLIRASIDDIADALSDRTERWERNVLGRDILLGDQGGAFVFRLRGHTWTEVLLESFKPIWSLDDRALSRVLKTRVIGYSVSDTSSYIGYRMYENGELLEALSVLDGGSEEVEGSSLEGDSDEPEGGNSFSSSLRDLKLADITNIWEFTARFLIDQDAFDPGIDFGYFLGASRRACRPPGSQFRIVNPGFTFEMAGDRVVSIPPIERIDYLALMEARGT